MAIFVISTLFVSKYRHEALHTAVMFIRRQGTIKTVTEQKVLPRTIQFFKTLDEDRAKLLHKTIKTLTRVLDKARIPYFMNYNTLLGSYRHHGRIPWDHDVAILVSISHRNKIIRLLNNISDHRLSNFLKVEEGFWNFYPVAGHKRRHYVFPNIDVYWFRRNSTHVWITHRSLRIDYYQIYDIFPTYRRPFNSLMLPAPCNTPLVLSKTYDDLNKCVSSYFSRQQRGPITVPCSQLYPVQPFVSRSEWSADGSNFITESLIFNNVVLSNWTYKRFQCQNA